MSRQNLFRINAWAKKYSQATEPLWWGAPSTPLDATNLTVCGEQAGADGNVWVVLPDNSEENITVSAPGVKHFNAWATPQKYRSYFEVFVRQPWPDFPNYSFPEGVPPLGYPAVNGFDTGHAWWKLTTEAPVNILNRFTTAANARWINMELGYSPSNSTFISYFPPIKQGGGYLEQNNGGDSTVHRTYATGFQGPGVIDGLGNCEALFENGGTWNSDTHNCVHETIKTGNMAGVPLPSTDPTPEGFGLNLPPSDP